jgi:hypothetical protein
MKALHVGIIRDCTNIIGLRRIGAKFIWIFFAIGRRRQHDQLSSVGRGVA